MKKQILLLTLFLISNLSFAAISKKVDISKLPRLNLDSGDSTMLYQAAKIENKEIKDNDTLAVNMICTKKSILKANYSCKSVSVNKVE